MHDIQGELKAKEDTDSTEKMMQDFLSKLQSENLDKLSQRIDQNDNHIKLLEEKDEQLESDLGEHVNNINDSIININGRVDALEKADDFLRKAHEEQMIKAQKIEEDESSLTKDLNLFKEDFDHFKEDQDLRGEKIDAKLEIVTKDAKDLHEDNDKILEKIRQLEGVSNENAEVINKFTIQNITFEGKLEEIERDSDIVKEKIDELETKEDNLEKRMEHAESNIRDAQDRLDDMKDLKVDHKVVSVFVLTILLYYLFFRLAWKKLTRN